MKTRWLALLLIAALLLPGLAAPAFAATQSEINQAINDGLAWLATQQNGDGSFGSGAIEYRLAQTATAVLAFENEGHFPGGGSAYSTAVENGLAFLFGNQVSQFAIGMQTHGDPDTDVDGQAVAWMKGTGREVYVTGMIMQAIVASNTPDRTVAVGPLAGQTYRQVMTDVVDWAAWGQTDTGSGRGGWRYYGNQGSSDNSTAQWPVLGLVAAEQWGIFAPQFVKDELSIWIDYVQNDSNGGSGYDGPNTLINISKTGGLLVEMYYVGDDKDKPRAQAAIGYVDSQWSGAPSGWNGNKGHPYAMFSVFKGLELMEVPVIPNAPANTETPAGDWWGDYSEFLVNAQLSSGAWGGYSSWNSWLATPWYIIILQATVFPIEVAVEVPDCACDGEGYTVDVHYSVERFEADGTLQVFKDGMPYGDPEILTDFIGSDTWSVSLDADDHGMHDWKAVLTVTGGGITTQAEDVDTIQVCETPQVTGIPDQTMPFQKFDLDDFLLPYAGGLTVEWAASGAPGDWMVTIDADNVVTVGAPAGAADPADITFTASVKCCDDVTCSSSDMATFVPNRPPDCSNAAPSIETIWPPNHKFVSVGVEGVTDPDGDPVTIEITAIDQDEPLDTYGDGQFEPDGCGVGAEAAELRAERSGSKKVPGNGRVYEVFFLAMDELEASCEGSVKVGVPHDRKQTPVDDLDTIRVDSTGGATACAEVSAGAIVLDTELFLPSIQSE